MFECEWALSGFDPLNTGPHDDGLWCLIKTEPTVFDESLLSNVPYLADKRTLEILSST